MARVRKSFRMEVGTWRQIATVAGLVGEDPQQFCERAVIERAQACYHEILRLQRERDESPGNAQVEDTSTSVYQELLRTQEQKRQEAEESTEDPTRESTGAEEEKP